ncbi:MAG: sigma-54-dependent Fis family transcriptional regulator [Deltaproteobacteria bacterium]|nr:sigma-54-dependent Fis family transcriptional regulator [Deltaproteobacteria bacterium]
MDRRQIEVLVVDDEQATCEFVGSLLKKHGYEPVLALSLSDAERLLDQKYFPIVVSDVELGGPESTTLLHHINRHNRPSLVIYITGQASIESAVKTIHEGAFDYISKPYELSEIEVRLIDVVEKAIQHLEILSIQDNLSVGPLSTIPRTIVGKSPPMAEIYKMIAKAALSSDTVLITGESGTGKELVARAIHDNSDRAKNPFVIVNISSIVETLLASELFGHVKGSFTGAVSSKRGLFQEANQGTLFLDEIGDISPAVQVSLLRAIQEGEIKPVGGTETHKVDVRIITATNKNLDAYVKEGKFREDLYYRLKVIVIEMPSLRKRKGDIPDLVNYFLSRSAQKRGKKVTTISREALAMLQAYSWPGNIRELENAIERAVALSNTSMLYAEDFPKEIRMPSETSIEKELTAASEQDSPIYSLEQTEKSHIIRALEKMNFNKARTAELLGIDRVTLYRKIRRLGIPLRPSSFSASLEPLVREPVLREPVQNK